MTSFADPPFRVVVVVVVVVGGWLLGLLVVGCLLFTVCCLLLVVCCLLLVVCRLLSAGEHTTLLSGVQIHFRGREDLDEIVKISAIERC